MYINIHMHTHTHFYKQEFEERLFVNNAFTFSFNRQVLFEDTI